MNIDVEVMNEEVCKRCKLFELHIEKVFTDGEPLLTLYSCEHLRYCQNAETRLKEATKKGKWMPVLDKNGIQDDDEWYGDLFQCSICGTQTIGSSDKFCSGCGVKMEKEEEL